MAESIVADAELIWFSTTGSDSTYTGSGSSHELNMKRAAIKYTKYRFIVGVKKDG